MTLTPDHVLIVLSLIGGFAVWATSLFAVWCAMDKRVSVLETKWTAEREASIQRALLIAALRVEDQAALKSQIDALNHKGAP